MLQAGGDVHGLAVDRIAGHGDLAAVQADAPAQRGVAFAPDLALRPVLLEGGGEAKRTRRIVEDGEDAVADRVDDAAVEVSDQTAEEVDGDGQAAERLRLVLPMCTL